MKSAWTALLLSCCVAACRSSQADDRTFGLIPAGPDFPSSREQRDPTDFEPSCADAGGEAPVPPTSTNFHDDGIDTGSPGFQLLAGAANVVVPQGGSAEIIVSVNRDAGFSEAITVGIEGLPAGVSLTALVVGGAETTGKITLSANSNVAVPIPELARVRGYAASGTKSTQVAVSVRGEPSSVDTSFSDESYRSSLNSVSDILQRPDGRILITGEGQHDHSLVVCQLTADGRPDLEFGTANGCATTMFDRFVTAKKLSFQGDRILVAGWTSTPAMFVARLALDGSLDPEFGTAGIVEVGTDSRLSRVFLVQTGDRIIVGGQEHEHPYGIIVRMDSEGILDPSFVVRIDEGITALAPRQNCGFVVSIGEELRAFTSTGALDPAWGENGLMHVPTYVGSLTPVGGNLFGAGEGMAGFRASETGHIEASYEALYPFATDSWQPALANRVNFGLDGAMILAGRFYFFEARVAIGRRLQDGTPDETFGPGGIRTYDPIGGAADVEITHDGRYIVGGAENAGDAFLMRVWD